MLIQQKFTPPELLSTFCRLRDIHREELVEKKNKNSPAGKIAEKAVWRSVFLTRRHGILSAD